LATRVPPRELTPPAGGRAGMPRARGRGAAAGAPIVAALAGAGYDGWYVLEQDTILTGEPAGAGPVADVAASAEHLRSVLAATA
ncbi:MAG: inosose dehydratase, partial [Pseudonocardia sp.]